MTKKVECSVASSLWSQIREYSFPDSITVRSIESNEDYQPQEYSLLILNRSTNDLYSKDVFRSEEKFDAVAYYNNSFNTPKDIFDVCNVLINTLVSPGILSYEQIRILMRLGILIYDGDINRIKGASYDLLLDKEYLRSGIEVTTAESIVIEPFDYVVVSAQESVNVPRNICGNFDLKVSMFCRGIILSNGPQVDPGYRGRLLSLLFNTSAKEFIMDQYKGFEFSTIQFQALSIPSVIPYKGQWRGKQSVKDYISAYADEKMSDRVKRITDMYKSMDEIKKVLKDSSEKITDVNNKTSSIEREVSAIKSSRLGLVAIISIFVAVVVTLFSIYATYNGWKDIAEIKYELKYHRAYDHKMADEKHEKKESLKVQSKPSRRN